MPDMKNMIKHVDLPTRQKLFFYELCKLGAVVFDLNNPSHFEVLMRMADLVKGKFDEGYCADEPYVEKMKLANSRMLDALIVRVIIQHAVKPD